MPQSNPVLGDAIPLGVGEAGTEDEAGSSCALLGSRELDLCDPRAFASQGLRFAASLGLVLWALWAVGIGGRLVRGVR